MGTVEYEMIKGEAKDVEVGDLIGFSAATTIRRPEWEVVSLEEALKHQKSPNYPTYWVEGNTAIVIELDRDGLRKPGKENISYMPRDGYPTYKFVHKLDSTNYSIA